MFVYKLVHGKYLSSEARNCKTCVYISLATRQRPPFSFVWKWSTVKGTGLRAKGRDTLTDTPRTACRARPDGALPPLPGIQVIYLSVA